MYQITVDGNALYDPRIDDLVVYAPKCRLATNTVGEASFTIYANHPLYNSLQKLRSVFEILQDGTPIFRGRMTDDSRDFNNIKIVDLEGVLGFFNDSVIPPFVFPDDFTEDAGYIEASTAEGGNVVAFFLGWLIDRHNEQVEEFQRFKLGRVTVSDPNNYLSRSAQEYANSWATLKTKLFDTSLGGYLCIRYEPDGNYIDYLADFATDDGSLLVNTQKIVFGENLHDLIHDSDASKTYSAVIPQGKRKNEIDESSNDTSRLTLADLADGILQTTPDAGNIIKKGVMIYSDKAVEKYGFICAPPDDTIWNDVTTTAGLRRNGIDYLVNTAIGLTSTITAKAIDLHLSDDEIAAFRIYSYVVVESIPHDLRDMYRLEQLDIDILNPQNSIITIGHAQMTMTDINSNVKQNFTEKMESSKVEIQTQVKQSMKEQSTSIIADCEKIMLEALENYVETGNFEEYKKTVVAQLSFLANEMTLKFTETISRIEEVDGDLQEKYNTITKYFTFDINGLTIGQIDNPNKVVIDNDEISILVNGTVVQKFDAEGKALIPVLTVTRALDLFGYIIEQDGEGRVNCDYVGG